MASNAYLFFLLLQILLQKDLLLTLFFFDSLAAFGKESCAALFTQQNVLPMKLKKKST